MGIHAASPQWNRLPNPHRLNARATHPIESLPMPALATAPAHTGQVLRPDLHYHVLFKEKKFSEVIASARVAAVANNLIQALADVDPQGEYSLITSQGKPFDYAIVDLRMQPNMIIAEAIGRTEAALLLRRLVRIDPSNLIRYAILSPRGYAKARVGQLDIQS